MFIIKDSQSGQKSEPFSGPHFWWLNGDQGYHPSAGITNGTQKIYLFSESSFNATYYTRTGTSDTFDDDANTCARAPTTEIKPLSEVKAARKSELAAKRKAVEVGGITVGGVSLPTEDNDQNKMTGATVAIERGYVSAPLNWKSAGGFIEIGSTTLDSLNAAVAQHIQACFTREKEITAEIDLCNSSSDVLAVNINSGWPS